MDMQEFVAYVAKDSKHGRACFVLQCQGSLANEVITTIGEAFEKRFRELIRSKKSSENQLTNDSCTERPTPPARTSVLASEPDYYNDLPTMSSSNPPSIPPPPLPVNDDIGLQLEEQVWYHGSIGRKESEELVLRDGDFLVRKSLGQEGQYVLTGREAGIHRHLLLVDPTGVVRTMDRTFDSICQLIDFHQIHCLPIIYESAESAVHLRHPVGKGMRLDVNENQRDSRELDLIVFD